MRNKLISDLADLVGSFDDDKTDGTFVIKPVSGLMEYYSAEIKKAKEVFPELEFKCHKKMIEIQIPKGFDATRLKNFDEERSLQKWEWQFENCSENPVYIILDVHYNETRSSIEMIENFMKKMPARWNHYHHDNPLTLLSYSYNPNDDCDMDWDSDGESITTIDFRVFVG